MENYYIKTIRENSDFILIAIAAIALFATTLLSALVAQAPNPPPPYVFKLVFGGIISIIIAVAALVFKAWNSANSST